MSRSLLVLLVITLTSSSIVIPATASVHLMQIQRIIGGVNGDTTAQAIQLRMRASFQNQMQQARLVVRNASGGVPVVLATPTVPVANHGAGVNVLFTTTSFDALTSPAAVADFTMSPIPAGYLSAGSLTFESNLGSVYWRVSWGGASYTGSGAGTTFNDLDGKFNPAFGASLPSASTTALEFTGSATALSTSNAANYAVSAPLVTVRNNSGAVFTVQDPATPAPVADRTILRLHPAVPNPFTPQTRIAFEIPRAGHVKLVVYGLDGSLVSVLRDEPMPAGPGAVVWGGTDREQRAVASGVYLVRLRTPDGQASQRVTLVK